MSATSDGDESRIHCLSTVLLQCVEKDQVKNLVLILLGERLINRGTKKALLDIDQQKQFVAWDKMIRTLLEKGKMTDIPEYLEDCDVPENIIHLVQLVIQGPRRTLRRLLQSWKVLLLHEKELQMEIGNVWPDALGRLKNDWPINFLCFCDSEEKTMDLQRFFASNRISKILQIQDFYENVPARDSSHDRAPEGRTLVKTETRTSSWTGQLGMTTSATNRGSYKRGPSPHRRQGRELRESRTAPQPSRMRGVSRSSSHHRDTTIASSTSRSDGYQTKQHREQFPKTQWRGSQGDQRYAPQSRAPMSGSTSIPSYRRETFSSHSKTQGKFSHGTAGGSYPRTTYRSGAPYCYGYSGARYSEPHYQTSSSQYFPNYLSSGAPPHNYWYSGSGDSGSYFRRSSSQNYGSEAPYQYGYGRARDTSWRQPNYYHPNDGGYYSGVGGSNSRWSSTQHHYYSPNNSGYYGGKGGIGFYRKETVSDWPQNRGNNYGPAGYGSRRTSWETQEKFLDDERVRIRVTVSGLTPQESLFLQFGDEGVSAEMTLLKDSVYVADLPAKYFEASYFYKVYDGAGNYRREESPGVKSRILGPRDRDRHIFDAAIFGTYDLPIQELWGERMLEHLRLHDGGHKDNLLQSEFSEWLDQIRSGWKVVDFDKKAMTISPSKETIEHRVLLPWLKSLSGREKVLVSVWFALNGLDHDTGEDVLREISIGFSLNTVSANEQQQLYSEILNLCLSDAARDDCSIGNSIFRVLKSILRHDVKWLLGLPLLSLITHHGNVPESRGSRIRYKLPLLCLMDGVQHEIQIHWIDLKLHYSGETLQRNLIALAPDIKKMTERHPWTALPYQYLLSDENVAHMIIDKCDTAKMFQLDCLLEKILHLLVSEENDQRTQSIIQATAPHFEEVLARANSADGSFSDDDITKSLGIIINILDSVSKTLDNVELNARKNILFCINLAVIVSDWSFMTLKTAPKHTDLKDITKSLFDTVSNSLSDEIARSDLNYSDIQFFDLLITQRWHEDVRSDWIKTVQTAIRHRIEQIWDKKEDEFFSFYTDELMPTISDNMELCFEDEALKCAENFLTPETLQSKGSRHNEVLIGKIKRVLKREKSSKKKPFFEKLFLRRCEKHEIVESRYDVKRILEFICEWPIAHEFFKKFNNKESLKNLPKAKPVISRIADVCKEFVQSLATRSILLGELKIISNHPQKICEFLLMFTRKTDTSTIQSLQRIIFTLDETMKTFYKERSTFVMFFDMCSEMESKRGGIFFDDCEKIKACYDKADRSGQICNFFTSDDIAVDPDRYFGLTKNDMDDFALMQTVKRSRVFTTLWLEDFETLKAKTAAPLDWKVVVRDLWKTVKERLRTLIEEISQGIVKLDVVLLLFSFTDGEKYQIQQELRLLFDFYEQAALAEPKDEHDAGSADRASEQIHDVFEIRKNSKIMNWALEYVEKLNLMGDFSLLEGITNLDENEDLCVRDIDDETLKKFPEELRQITTHQLVILQRFLAQEKLILWLLKKSEQDMEKVKNWCKLLMVSAGEAPFEIDHVTHLISAVEGFAPLLFRLNDISNLNDLRERCDAMWRNVEDNVKLIEKWDDSGNHLPWFVEKEVMFGSDQHQSLKYAQYINERGVYTVGKQTYEHPTLENSISLTLRQEDPATRQDCQRKSPEVFDLQYLKDLQSKFALIAGKDGQGQPDISQFVDIFTAVKTLAGSFINLVNAGCMLFNDWTAVITSSACRTGDRQNELYLTLTLHFITNITPLKGPASLSLLNELSKTLRQEHDRWTEYIRSKSLQHYYLNEFNIKQITYLCNQLANPSGIASLPDQVLALLRKDSRSLLPAKIQDALDDAIRIEDSQETQDAQAPEDNHNENDDLSKLKKKKRVIRMIMQNEGQDEQVAKAAVQAVGYEDYEKCSTWILVHQYDDELVKRHLQEFNVENAYTYEESTQEQLVDVLHNRAVNSLTEMIRHILKMAPAGDTVQLVGATKTICARYFERTSVLTVQDYLSIEHLGKFLTNLHADTEIYPVVHRTLPESLEAGKPNLIVCPDGDTLPLLLSLYMNNQKGPLPTPSEVLLCSEQTTSGDVERFMRRAMCKCDHNGEPLFCMANSEKLNFKVSQALENFFEALSHQDKYINQNYQLVIISTSQQHYIYECFDKYENKIFTKSSNQSIYNYLKSLLSTNPDHPICDEFGSSIVKVVASDRSGVGKSLYIKKMSDKLDRRWYENSEIEHMNALVGVLNRCQTYPRLPDRYMPPPLAKGEPNLILCSERDILPALLSLYMTSPREPLPSASEILLCCRQTTEQEVERFLRRAMCTPGNRLFTIAYGERLSPMLARKIRLMSETLGRNAQCRTDFQLVIFSRDATDFAWCRKLKIKAGSNHNDSTRISAFLAGRKRIDASEIKLEVFEDEWTDSGDLDCTPEPVQEWHKTTVRLLEKAIDINHVVDRLSGGEDIRNEEKHFIHIDLTPAVEDGIERLMFNLLILGSIHDDTGKVWNRHKQHRYVIEMTENALTRTQIEENSILHMLPKIYCTSPKQSLDKLRTIRERTRKWLSDHLSHFERDANPDIYSLMEHIEDNAKFSLENFRYEERNLGQSSDDLESLLYLAGVPPSMIFVLKQSLSAESQKLFLQTQKEYKLHSTVLMSYEEFISAVFQRPYQYLKYSAGKSETDILDRMELDLDDYQYSQPAGTPEDCINTLLQCDAVGTDPSWTQLLHFVSFLNVQLQNCEESQFCQKVSSQVNGSDEKSLLQWHDTELKGLKAFAVKFMIMMSRDFATPSLAIADESRKDNDVETIETHRVRNKWEEKCHPYVFFNEDRASMSFINVDLNSEGDLLDDEGNVLQEGIASTKLMLGLRLQKLRFGFNFHEKTRKEKLNTIRTIMGLPHFEEDPDPTYELTTDNVLKILAIYMRMRCNIPVVLMGETGCGKTRLIDFLSRIRSQGETYVRNMVTLKIHGGVVVKDIFDSVKKANQLAAKNAKDNVATVLFYDEANTTTAIYAIKEVICDGTVNGESFRGSHLQVVAACNPYKELTEKAIKILEKSGLGYRVSTTETSNRLGTIPMRRLVYKVVPLPPSIQPFVWDFGELSMETEKKYICQMTSHLQRKLDLSNSDKDLVDFVFCAAQAYMKNEMKDECRYVSLRDIERCMEFFLFFRDQAAFLFPEIKKRLSEKYTDCGEPPEITQTLRCLIQTMGVCYHVSLHERQKFREHLAESLRRKNVFMSEEDIEKEIISCQDAFLNNLKMEENIAPNEALRENVFLITICAHLRIPLFLVGKPGSSKSLARTIVDSNMVGENSESRLFKRLRQINMVTYQCSALTDAKGIENVFNKCCELQKRRGLESFTAVAVLDEIGLAEDSNNMPLKVLHPLLECGQTISGTLVDTEPERKVGFLGISNWALDPAKMNRGIFVARSTPTKDDLLETAKGIMKKDFRVMDEQTEISRKLTEVYLDIYNKQIQTESKEYFGLRDYYALIKMVNASSSSKAKCEFKDVAIAAQRNFGGGEQSHFEAFTTAVEGQYMGELVDRVSVQDMIRQNLTEQDTRFLMLLTTQHASISLLEHVIPGFNTKVRVIYGSSFPGDHDFTEICRNINRIKVWMETGGTVVLLDMTELHESLYDALNQHYTTYGGQRYVDIGLGGNRVKCRIADNFRLIVMEQKDAVYSEYPIPLVNRLEKHHLISESLLSEHEKHLSKQVADWAKTFSSSAHFTERDAFIGYHSDTASTLVLSRVQEQNFNEYKKTLLQTATADAIIRATQSTLLAERNRLTTIYTEEQVHDNLVDLLRRKIEHNKGVLSRLEVTSFSNILTEQDRKQVARSLDLKQNNIMLLSLQQFDTQQEYLSRLNTFFSDSKEMTEDESKVLLIQCPQAQKHGSLIACAKYCLTNMLKDITVRGKQGTIIIAFLLSTRRQFAKYENTNDQLIVQHGATSEIVYVDDLRPTGVSSLPVSVLYKKSLTDILQIGARELSSPNTKAERKINASSSKARSESEDVANLAQRNFGGSIFEIDGQELSSPEAKPERRINFIGLLKDIVCQSMAKVHRASKHSSRNLRCIKQLWKFFSEDNRIGDKFRCILVQNMIKIYSDRDRDAATVHGIRWIINEAKSAKNLQEGGTFGKTLCLCLKRHLADLLAYIISKVDENNNLEFLLDDETTFWKQELWIKLFEVYKFEWSDMKGLAEFCVQISAYLPADYSPQLPFSSTINAIFESRWEILQNDVELQRTKIVLQHFRDTQEAHILQELCRQGHADEIIHSYAADVIRCLFKFRNADEKNVIQLCQGLTRVLLVVSNKLTEKFVEDGIFQDGDDLAVVYYSSKQYFNQLHVLHDIFNIYPESSSRVDGWIDKQKQYKEPMVHVFAMASLLEWVATLNIEDENACVRWMNLSNKCKEINRSCGPVILHPDHEEQILANMKQISLLDLLLLQLLPDKRSHFFKNYVGVIVQHARRLVNALNTSDIPQKDFPRIVLNILRRSYEDIRLKILIDWEEPTCGMCRKVLKKQVRLPCGHFLCGDCVNQILATAEARRRCPRCAEQIPIDFERISTEPTLEQEKQIMEFKVNCTSFFLQYLSQFCLSDNGPGMEIQAKMFLYELVAGVSENEDKFMLETLAIDLNIATRSNIFQLLLRNHPDIVENEIGILLTRLSEEPLEKLLIVMLHGMETRPDAGFPVPNLEDTWESVKNQTTGIDMSTINNIAYLRTVLLDFIDDMGIDVGDASCAQEDLVRMCTTDETGTLGTFVIKSGCQAHGLNWFNVISKHEKFKDIIPEYLRNSANDGSVDYWLILGDKYAKVREALHKMSFGDYRQQLCEWINGDQEAVEELPVVLAVVWHGDMRHRNYLEQRLREDKLLEIIRLLKKPIVGISEQKSRLLNQLIILLGSILICKPLMMNNYHFLATNPAGVGDLFWPAMPESSYFSIREILEPETDVAAYECPNGHIYFIGECTRPWAEAECPECGKTIGGRLHQAAEGNQRIEQSEASQAGYQLLSDVKGKDDPCDRLSKQGVAIVHFITHCCMLIGLKQDPETLCGMLKENNADAARDYLIKKLQDNIDDLSKALGRNYDEAVIVMHKCIASLIDNGFQDQCGATTGESDSDIGWGTMPDRKIWEVRFRTRYLVPIFKNLDEAVIEAQRRINVVENLHDAVLYKVVNEVNAGNEGGELSWCHPKLWRVVRHSKPARLLQTVRDSQDSGRVLRVILESSTLHLLKHLENVLALQKLLIEKYQNRKDMKQVDEITFNMYMTEADGQRPLIEEYIMLWNKLFKAFRVDANKQLWQYLDDQITCDSPISMALPSSRGRGRCAKLLAEYLIDIHNDFLKKCLGTINLDPDSPLTAMAVTQVDIPLLLTANFIRINKENDLPPLISMHTAYNIDVDDSGRHHHITYNIGALEKQVVEDYLSYRPMINKKSLPCITYPQDIGIGSDWSRLLENIEQVPLPTKIVQELDGLVANQDYTPADVCDGVRTLTHAITFLARSKSEESKTSLHTYLEKKLLLSQSHMRMIPRSAAVSDTLALYQRLMWHKAVNFVQQGLDPYQEALYRVDQEEITDRAVLLQLKEAFEHMDMGLFQQRLNEILIQVPDHNPKWSLKDEIFPFLEFLEGSDAIWFERIPSEIYFKHISHLFQLAVKGVVMENYDFLPEVPHTSLPEE